MFRTVSLTVGLGLALASTACRSQAAPRPPGDGEPASHRPPMAIHLDDAEIYADAQALMTEMEISAVRRAELENKLRGLLADPEFKKVRQREGVEAIGVYRLGEGGLLVKVAKGSGAMRFAGGEPEHRFSLETTSFGAQIGGSASWGLVIALGLPDPHAVEGVYTGEVTTATAIQSEAGSARMTKEVGGYTLYLVGVGAGLSANAGAGQLTLALQ